MANPIERLRYHVSGAIERGEKQAIAGIPAQEARHDPYGYFARKAAREAGIRAAAPYRIASSGARFADYDELVAHLRDYGLAVDPGNCSAGRYAIFDPASGYVCDWLSTGKGAAQ